MCILSRLLPALLLACAALAPERRRLERPRRRAFGGAGDPAAAAARDPPDSRRTARRLAVDERGRIDSVRYPNFAKLAAGATWFRNAHTIYDSTTKAVPLILNGRRPRPGSSPDRRGHPRSIFDMFARRGYRIEASEEATALCRPRLCRGGRTSRPAILPNLGHGRDRRFRAFLHRIRSARRPGSSTVCWAG